MKYFKEKEELESKISLKKHFEEIDMKFNKISNELKKYQIGGCVESEILDLIQDLKSKESKISLEYRRVKHIYEALGDVYINISLLEVFYKLFDKDNYRYGSTRFKKGTVVDLHKISLLFQELSDEALFKISTEYIKDLFEEYNLLDILNKMIREYGAKDSTFEDFIDIVRKKADILEERFKTEAWHFRIFYGYYSYDFIRHFEKIIKENHITLSKLKEVLPDPKLILEDELILKKVNSMAKECWISTIPISYQYIESILDGDENLEEYPFEPCYYISYVNEKFPTAFTKQDFLDSIKLRKNKKIRKKELK